MKPSTVSGFFKYLGVPRLELTCLAILEFFSHVIQCLCHCSDPKVRVLFCEITNGADICKIWSILYTSGLYPGWGIPQKSNIIWANTCKESNQCVACNGQNSFNWKHYTCIWRWMIHQNVDISNIRNQVFVLFVPSLTFNVLQLMQFLWIFFSFSLGWVTALQTLKASPACFYQIKRLTLSLFPLSFLLFYQNFSHLKNRFLMMWLHFFLFTGRKFFLRQKRWQKGTGESYLFLLLESLIPFQPRHLLSMMNLDCIQTGNGLNLNEVINLNDPYGKLLVLYIFS